MNEKMKIRTLFPDEIEVKTQSVRKNGVVAVLYKDSRVDMNILDETFGTMGWKNEHFVVDGKTFCTISIWDDDKKEWVTKSNVGSLDSGAPGAAKVKGEISDSFKRAATVVGIGRELYTSPFIWIGSDKLDIQEINGKCICRTELRVNVIEYDENRRIRKLEVVNAKSNAPVFRWISTKNPASVTKQAVQNTEPTVISQDNTDNPFLQPKGREAANATAEKPKETVPYNTVNEPASMSAGPAGNGTIKVEEADSSDTTPPGDAIIPIGYARGETLSEYYQREAKRATDKGLEVNVEKIFEFFEKLSAPQFEQFKSNVQQFKASLKAAS